MRRSGFLVVFGVGFVFFVIDHGCKGFFVLFDWGLFFIILFELLWLFCAHSAVI